MLDGSKDQGSVSPEGRTLIGTLPETHLGAFIGKGGCNIKQFEVDCGCKITLDSVTREVYTECMFVRVPRRIAGGAPAAEPQWRVASPGRLFLQTDA